MTPKELQAWLERVRLSQGELAKHLGVHIITVNRWANGAREIPPFLPLALETLERRQKLATKKKTK